MIEKTPTLLFTARDHKVVHVVHAYSLLPQLGMEEDLNFLRGCLVLKDAVEGRGAQWWKFQAARPTL